MTGNFVRFMTTVLSGALLASASPAAGQSLYGEAHLRNSSYVGLGYVASLPELFVGFSALRISRGILGGAGLYADVKFSTTSPAREPNYDPSITVGQAQDQFGDFLVKEQSTWLAVDLALVYAVTRELALYAGGGYAREHHYQQYFDNSQTRGQAGFYWIADPAASGGRTRAVGGIFVRATPNVAFQAGLDAQPMGAAVGVVFMLPK